MKENKEYQIKFRLTANLKTQIENYCAVSGQNTSEFIRMVITEFLGGQKDGE